MNRVNPLDHGPPGKLQGVFDPFTPIIDPLFLSRYGPPRNTNYYQVGFIEVRWEFELTYKILVCGLSICYLA